MRANIVPIGNSKGIRIPKVILEQCNIDKEVIMEVDKDKIVIMPTRKKPRKGWEQAFKYMSKNQHDKLYIDDKLDLTAGDWKW